MYDINIYDIGPLLITVRSFLVNCVDDVIHIGVIIRYEGYHQRQAVDTFG